jgi:D-alanyl-D-alanine carboxypeptidase-like protein
MGTFYTDVIEQDPRFTSVARVSDPELLEPITRQLVEGIIADAQQQGIELMIFETYRSQERQEQLFLQGATQLRQVGVHHFGLACDIVKSINGDPSWKGDFSIVGQLAQSAGLVWGGNWGNPNIHHTFIDQPHVQRCTIARQASLIAGSWYPDDLYNPLDDEQSLMFASISRTTRQPSRAKAASVELTPTTIKTRSA